MQRELQINLDEYFSQSVSISKTPMPENLKSKLFSCQLCKCLQRKRRTCSLKKLYYICFQIPPMKYLFTNTKVAKSASERSCQLKTLIKCTSYPPKKINKTHKKTTTNNNTHTSLVISPLTVQLNC